MAVESSKRLDTFDLVARPVGWDDLDRLHELSIAVNWPHRAEDWRTLLTLGSGVAACDEIGRIVGCAMRFPTDGALNTIGMVITSPRMQAQGAGMWLMREILEQIGDAPKMLSATRAAYRLYVTLNFMPLKTVHQLQGISKPRAAPEARNVRNLVPGDFEAIRALDEQAFGFGRTALLRYLTDRHQGTVIEEGGRVTGFAICHKFGKGWVIGPIVADTETDAIALAAPHFAVHAGEFVRVDTREQAGPFKEFLIASGVVPFDTVTTMLRDVEAPVPGRPHSFALTTQAFG